MVSKWKPSPSTSNAAYPFRCNCVICRRRLPTVEQNLPAVILRPVYSYLLRSYSFLFIDINRCTFRKGDAIRLVECFKIHFPHAEAELFQRICQLLARSHLVSIGLRQFYGQERQYLLRLGTIVDALVGFEPYLQSGSSTGSETAEGYALTISTSGSGSASVSHDGNAVTSGDSLNEDDEVEISITPATGQVPTATLNGSEIELTEDGGVYSGNFAMPAEASTLVINTGTESDDDGLDKD